MNRCIVLLLCAFSTSAFGETYLCIPEVAVGVASGGISGIYQFQVDDPDVKKIIFSDVSGSWEVKFVEKAFNPSGFTCKTKHFCECVDSYCGHFRLRRNGIFSMNDLSYHYEKKELLDILLAGRCTLIY